MLTAKDLHKRYRLSHLDAKHWDDVSPLAKWLYAAMARELNEERCIAAVKCPTCHEMIDAYASNEHVCTNSDVLKSPTASTSQVN